MSGSHYDGAEWVRSSMRHWKKVKGQPRTMSALGEKVADLLGDLYFGIYHLDGGALQRVEWENEHHISIVLPWSQSARLCTYDSSDLTVLVLLCHDRCIRLELEAANTHFIRLTFYERSRDGDTYHRHPTMEEQIDRWRGHYGEEPGIITLRPEVRWFAEQMELKLRANDHKPGWKDDAVVDLLTRLEEELAELREAIDESEPAQRVIEEAADVANFCLMISDNAQAVEEAMR